MPYRILKLSQKKQADGAQSFDLAGYEETLFHQLTIELSSTPAAGTMAVAIRSPGGSQYITITTLDLTAGSAVQIWYGRCDSLQLTPASLSTNVHYDAFLNVTEGQ